MKIIFTNTNSDTNTTADGMGWDGVGWLGQNLPASLIKVFKSIVNYGLWNKHSAFRSPYCVS